MREFTCQWCGKVAISKTCGGYLQKYCSKECKMKAYHAQMKYQGESCLHNPEIICKIPKCDTCGWNPEVEKKRKELLRCTNRD